MTQQPRIGITMDIADDRFRVGRRYAELVDEAGGVPLLLPCIENCVNEYIELCHGFIFTGGDDPIMEDWNVLTHPKATKVDPARQAFELALFDALMPRDETPVLGVCLGMQYMGLIAGGELDQHLPDTLPTAQQHWGRVEHEITGDIGEGIVQSHHRQALTDAGSLTVIGRSPDGVIEAVRDPRKPFYLGVQWHPERTDDRRLGAALIEQLVAVAKRPYV